MSTDSNKPVTFTNETIDKHFADERAAYELSRVHDRVRADAIEVFNRTGKTPSQLAERLEVLRNDLEWALTWINNEAKHLRKRGQPQPALELLLEMVKTRHGIDLSTPPTNVK